MEIAGPWKERKANETALKHVVSKPYLKNRSRACHFARLLFTHNIHPFRFTRFTSVSAPRAPKSWNRKSPFADAPDSGN